MAPPHGPALAIHAWLSAGLALICCTTLPPLLPLNHHAALTSPSQRYWSMRPAVAAASLLWMHRHECLWPLPATLLSTSTWEPCGRPPTRGHQVGAVTQQGAGRRGRCRGSKPPRQVAWQAPAGVTPSQGIALLAGWPSATCLRHPASWFLCPHPCSVHPHWRRHGDPKAVCGGSGGAAARPVGGPV